MSSSLIEALKSKTESQHDFLAINLSVEARQYYTDDWGEYTVVSSTAACPIYYYSYLSGMDETEVRQLPPDNPYDLNLGYFQVPRNTIDTLSSNLYLLKEYLLLVDRLLRLEDYMRINSSKDEGLAKKIDRGLEIISKIIPLLGGNKLTTISESLESGDMLIQHPFLIEHLKASVANIKSK